jgi:protocatechuate 4,5-dioxygenase alpha chain
MKDSESKRANPYPGSYLLTVSLAQRAYRLSQFCRSLMSPAQREAFRNDAEACMSAEKAMRRARDWLAMGRDGVNHFLVFRVAGAFGEGLAAAGAQMRGETLEQFRKTRRVWEER